MLNSDSVWYIGNKLLLLNGVVGAVLCVLLIWGLQSHRVQRITPALVFIPISVILSLDVLLNSHFFHANQPMQQHLTGGKGGF